MLSRFGQFLSRTRAATSASLTPYVQRRDYRVWHYASDDTIANVRQSDQLNPGSGNLGHGVYTTTHQPGVASNFEIATALRNPRLPFSRFSSHVSFDTDDLDKFKIPYQKKGSTVFLPRDSALRLKTINARFGTTPGGDDDPLRR